MCIVDLRFATFNLCSSMIMNQLEIAIAKFSNIDKWVSDENPNDNSFNTFLTTFDIINCQILQLLKLYYNQYMGQSILATFASDYHIPNLFHTRPRQLLTCAPHQHSTTSLCIQG